MERVILRGTVVSGEGWATKHGKWPCMLVAHADEVPDLSEYVLGTFNVNLVEPKEWTPPRDALCRTKARDRGYELSIDFLQCGNYIHPDLDVVRVNREPVNGKLYYPGNQKLDKAEAPSPIKRPRIEIISKTKLREFLGLQDGEDGLEVEVVIAVSAPGC